MHRHIQMFVILYEDTNVRMSIHRVRNKQCLQKCAKKICSPWTDWEMVFFFKKKTNAKKTYLFCKKDIIVAKFSKQKEISQRDIGQNLDDIFNYSIQLFQRWKQRSNIYTCILKNLGSITRAATNCARRKNRNSL